MYLYVQCDEICFQESATVESNSTRLRTDFTSIRFNIRVHAIYSYENGAQTANAKTSWRLVGPKTACDTGADEVYMQNSPGTVSNLKQCKTSCEQAAECRSITYYDNGWCSHYSTPFTTTLSHNAVALQIISGSDKVETLIGA